MRPTVHGSRVVAILLLLLVFALAALAGLQYRWINKVSEADRDRRHAAAEFVARRIANELRDEIFRTFGSFLSNEDADVAPLYDAWLRDAQWPELIANVYVAQRDGTNWTLYRLDQWQGSFVESQWPRELEPMREPLGHLDVRGPQARWPGPLFDSGPGLFIVPKPANEERGRHVVPYRVILVHFDRKALSEKVMPALIEQVSASGFDVNLAAPHGTIYRSAAAWSGDRPDAMADVPTSPPDRDRRPEPPPERPGPPDRKDGGRGGPPPREEDWQVLVRYRAGSLDQLVASTRLRNLGVSGGILAILAAGVAVLGLLMRRAERLRAQEAAFVSVMSHELNTPVAVLRSAGENLKDGIVAGDQVAVYGDTIVQEADRLKHMIAEVLELAGMQARTEARPLKTVAVAPIIEAAVERCRLLANGKIILDADIEPDLPPVAADDDALGRAIQNLIVNAIRHGGSGGWVGVRARRDGKRVTITVEDRGPGIDAEDFDQIFEPFYRGRDSANVSGAGLGLTIVKQIAIDHGGSVTLDRIDSGAAFTIHLPAEVSRA